ncbi:MAG TPA: hypothetical protein VI757_07330 [Bacteroidia bacterium]|nr:hypothetical protein [Bacteroidia bacterium]
MFLSSRTPAALDWQSGAVISKGCFNRIIDMMPGEAEALLCLHSHPDFAQCYAPVAFGTAAGLAFGAHRRFAIPFCAPFRLQGKCLKANC